MQRGQSRHMGSLDFIHLRALLVEKLCKEIYLRIFVESINLEVLRSFTNVLFHKFFFHDTRPSYRIQKQDFTKNRIRDLRRILTNAT
jgi:hypothetical protein